MTIEELLRRASSGEAGAVHLLVGTERFLIERAVARLRKAVLGEGLAGLNEDRFDAQASTATQIVEAARTLPMMSSRRFVLVRGLESADTAKLEPLVAYFKEPSPTTCLVLTAEKLHGGTRLSRAAKKLGLWVDVAPLRPGQLSAFARSEAAARGHQLSPEAAAALLEATGNDLAGIDDAIERLSLFVGPRASVGVEAVQQCVSHLRVESVWTLVDAVSQRDAATALRSVASLLADREPALRILALLARQFRMLARMRSALRGGALPQQAAQQAGAPAFKPRELAQASRRFGAADLRRAFCVLAQTDRKLKNTRQAPSTVLEGAVLRLCE